ncbi:MAG TPA: oxidoreductase, partial [Armatimonadetes bacterium]|nr:oxidoreductase [Armatimonadota bacterium]
MKKKIGFIDYYIDEWHSNNYPRMISEGAYKDKFEVALAWEEITPEGKRPLDAWCREMGIGKAESIEQVVEECDCIVVLSPNNSERHEARGALPLKSGKPVYIDKPFAPSLKVAKRLFAKADKYGTPLMSSSALRFGSHLDNALKEIGTEQVKFASERGGGMSFKVYCIHQLEIIAMTMGMGAKRIMQCGNGSWELMTIDYGDGRRAAANWEYNSQ